MLASSPASRLSRRALRYRSVVLTRRSSLQSANASSNSPSLLRLAPICRRATPDSSSMMPRKPLASSAVWKRSRTSSRCDSACMPRMSSTHRCAAVTSASSSPSTAPSAMSCTSGRSCSCAARTSATRPAVVTPQAGSVRQRSTACPSSGSSIAASSASASLISRSWKNPRPPATWYGTPHWRSARIAGCISMCWRKSHAMSAGRVPPAMRRAHSRATAMASLRSSGACQTSTAAPGPRSATRCFSMRVAGLATEMTAREAVTICSVLR